MDLQRSQDTYTAVLTIAGSDPSGGAGIQADLKTFAAHGCYGTSVITSLTAQNTMGVQGVHPVPPSFVGQQIRSVLDDIHVGAIKTGMIYDASICAEIAQVLGAYSREGKLAPIVCDPVCVSTSGHTLLHLDALDVLIRNIFPLSTLITPNKSEAELLLSQLDTAQRGVNSLEEMLEGAAILSKRCSTAVLLKGGHLISSFNQLKEIVAKHPELEIVKHGLLQENMEIIRACMTEREEPALVLDLLYQLQGPPVLFAKPRIESKNTHGTGCTLSAAVACGLAQGLPVRDAVDAAILYTHIGITAAEKIGSGIGPLNHLHSLTRTMIPKRTPSTPFPFSNYLIQNSKLHWKGYVEHPFVKDLGKGVLSIDRFQHFITQDYHYLKYYSQAYGLLAAKSSTYPAIEAATTVIRHVLDEVNTHRTFCKGFGVEPAELDNIPEATATTAYGAYLLTLGMQGSASDLIMALMACLLGYGEVGLWLKKEAALPGSWVVMEGNPYKTWIEVYSGEPYQAAVQKGLETLEELVTQEQPPPRRIREWLAIWTRCVRLERGFWDMAMELRE